MESSGFCIRRILSAVNRDCFTSSFLIYMTFTAFYFLIVVDRISHTILNRSWHLCFVLDSLGKTFNLSLLIRMLTLGFLYLAFIMLRYVLLYLIFWAFLSLKDVISCQVLFCIWHDHRISSFILLMWCITFTDLCM